MSKLNDTLQRLYALPGHAAPESGELALLSADGKVRTLLINVERGSDWPQVAALWQGVQDELELPPPALAVSPLAGFQVWFSLAEPVELAQGERFLRALAEKYLVGVPAARWSLQPTAGDAAAVVRVPAWHAGPERWSAYIDPGMGSLFVAETGLEIEPNPERQADMLGALRSISPRDFQRALEALAAAGAARVATPATPDATLRLPGVGGGFADPHSFLLAVMNDPSASAEHRIRAACALLPYFPVAKAS